MAPQSVDFSHHTGGNTVVDSGEKSAGLRIVQTRTFEGLSSPMNLGAGTTLPYLQVISAL